MRPNIDKPQYFARDGQSLHEHLDATARTAELFAKPFGLEHAACAAARLHDLGKFTQAYQNYLKRSLNGEDTIRGEVIHALQGAKYLSSQCRDLLIADILGNVIASHHGGLFDTLIEGTRTLERKLQFRAAELNYEEAIEAYRPTIQWNLIREEIANVCSTAISHQLPAFFMLHLATKALFSCLVDADRCNAAGLDPANAVPNWKAWLYQLEKYLGHLGTGKPLDRVRHHISSECARAGSRPLGIYTLSVPTGGGKTLASMRFALQHAHKHNLKHIIYVIPYLSILDQTAKIFYEVFDEACREQIFEHHSNIDVPDIPAGTNSDEYEHHKLLAARWDSPIVLTTMVQFLETIYSNRASRLRKFHNMSDAVIIFDEVQSLPIKCTHLFNESINFLHHMGGSTILLCTATQPHLEKVEHPVRLTANPSLVALSENKRNTFRRVHISNQSAVPYMFDDIAELAKHNILAGKSTLIILNTKTSANEVYKLCKGMDLGCPHVLLTTNLCPAHRKAKLGQITGRPKGDNILCVSTQLIEAGVDLSFDCVIRAAAGLDSIVQAAGRCNRNGEHAEPQTVYVVDAVEEKLERLPEIADGKEVTKRIGRELHGISLLHHDALELFYYYYFFNHQEKMSYPVEQGTRSLYSLLNDNPLATQAYKDQNNGQPYKGLPAAFQSAADHFSVIDNGQVGIVVPYGNAMEHIARFQTEYDPVKRPRLLQQLQQFSVNVFSQTLGYLLEAKAIHPINDSFYLLSPDWYDDEYGLMKEPKPKFLNI